MLQSYLKKFISKETTTLGGLGYLFIRLCFGLLLAKHGYAKIISFNDYALEFYDPFGIGGKGSLSLVIFAEFVCSIAIAIGFLTRLASIPIVINFITIFFFVHGGDPLDDKELAAVYLVLSLGILLIGSGKYSVDRALKL